MRARTAQYEQVVKRALQLDDFSQLRQPAPSRLDLPARDLSSLKSPTPSSGSSGGVAGAGMRPADKYRPVTSPAPALAPASLPAPTPTPAPAPALAPAAAGGMPGIGNLANVKPKAAVSKPDPPPRDLSAFESSTTPSAGTTPTPSAERTVQITQRLSVGAQGQDAGLGCMMPGIGDLSKLAGANAFPCDPTALSLPFLVVLKEVPPVGSRFRQAPPPRQHWPLQERGHGRHKMSKSSSVLRIFWRKRSPASVEFKT